MNKRITIKDIAKSLGIHHSTVSRALRDDSLVKDATKKMIVDFANKHGYQVNNLALELRGEVKNKLALIVPNINHYFFSNVVSHITDLAARDGYIVSIFQTNESLELEKNIIDSIIQHNFSGVIASISMESKDCEHFKKLINHNIPLVMFDRVSDAIDVSKVVINNSQIVAEAVSILIKRGYKRITHISGPKDFAVFGERQKGYRLALKKGRLDFENIITAENGFDTLAIHTIIDELTDPSLNSDSIICDSSMLGIELMKEMYNRSISIPNQIAVIIFNENPIMDLVSPSISSIKQPSKQIAENVLMLIKEKILKPLSKNVTIKLSAEIIIRDSI